MHPQALYSERTPELTHKASRLPVQLSACSTSSLWSLASCFTSPLPVSPGHAPPNLRASDLLIHFISYQKIIAGCLCVVYLENLLHGFFLDLVLLIFYHLTHLRSHLNTCCGCKPIIHFHPQRFPLLLGHKCMFVSFHRTHACISVCKQSFAHSFSTHPFTQPAGWKVGFFPKGPLPVFFSLLYRGGKPPLSQ